MSRVFVSYTTADAPLAEELRTWIVDDHHEVFLGCHLRDGIAVGDDWQARLHERLRWADAVVCVVTAAYLQSPWCSAEVGIAQSRGSRMLPVIAETGVVHPLLQPIQCVELGEDGSTARRWLSEALRRLDVIGGTSLPDDRSPFPGLRAFDVKDHRVFFGRAREVEELRSLLASAEIGSDSLLTIIGPSGCGKSSLVRAGLHPAVMGEVEWWALSPISPGSDPVAGLAYGMAAAARALDHPWEIAETRRRIEDGGLGDLADELLLAASPRERPKLLIVIDQFEELFTQTPPAGRGRFAEVLASAAGRSIRLVVTLRPEFLDRLLSNPDFAALRVRTYPIRPLSRESLSTVIRQPAELAGFGIDADLVERMAADTGSGEALPLLAYTLAQLADGVSRGGRLLTSRYDQLGGVGGTLIAQADLALAEAMGGGRRKTDVIRSLMRLVTVDELGQPTRWHARRSELDSAVLTDLTPFTEKRLVGSDTGEDGPTISVAHEAFLSTWPPLASSVAENARALRARRSIELAAQDWGNQGRPPKDLWERGQLAAALAEVDARVRSVDTSADDPSGARHVRRRLTSDRVELTANALQFLQAAIRRDRRRRGASTAVLVLLVLLASTAAIVATVQARSAEQGQRTATARFLMAGADAARLGDPRTALLLGEAANRVDPGPETKSDLLHTVTTTRYAGTLPTGTNASSIVAFAAKTHTLAIASSNGTVLWDVIDPARPDQLGPPLAGSGSVIAMAFSPEGTVLASGSQGATVLWDVHDPRQPVRQDVGLVDTAAVGSLAFSGNGQVLAVTGSTAITSLWDVSRPAQPRRLSRFQGSPTRAESTAFSVQSPLFVSVEWGGAATVWDLRNPTQPRQVGAPFGSGLDAAAFAPDGPRLAVGMQDGSVVVWDLSDPSRPVQLGRPVSGHHGVVDAVGFSPDGQTLATTGPDASILWDAGDPAGLRRIGDPLTSPGGPDGSMAFLGAERLAAAGSTGGITLWNVRSAIPDRLPELPSFGYPNALSFAPTGRALAVAGSEGTQVLDLDDPAHPRTIPLSGGCAGAVNAATFGPDGQTLETAGDKGLMLWDLAAANRSHCVVQYPAANGPQDAAHFSPDGHLLATADYRGHIFLRDLTHPTQLQSIDATDPGPGATTTAEVFSGDAHLLATGDERGTTRLWDVSDPARAQPISGPLTTDKPVTALAFSPDRRTIAIAAENGAIALWDITDVAHPKRREAPLQGQYASYSMMFSPDGQMLAVGSQTDSATTLWDLTDAARPQLIGESFPAFEGPAGSFVRLVAFSADGQILITAGDAGVAWDLHAIRALRANPIGAACAITGAGVDPDSWSRLVPQISYVDTCAAR